MHIYVYNIINKTYKGDNLNLIDKSHWECLKLSISYANEFYKKVKK